MPLTANDLKAFSLHANHPKDFKQEFVCHENDSFQLSIAFFTTLESEDYHKNSRSILTPKSSANFSSFIYRSNSNQRSNQNLKQLLKEQPSRATSEIYSPSPTNSFTFVNTKNASSSWSAEDLNGQRHKFLSNASDLARLETPSASSSSSNMSRSTSIEDSEATVRSKAVSFDQTFDNEEGMRRSLTKESRQFSVTGFSLMQLENEIAAAVW